MLVRTHEASLRRYTRRLAAEEGDDIAQDALLAAWRALGSWRGDGSFAGWLRRIAVRKFLDRQRRTPEFQFLKIDATDACPSAEPDRRIAVGQALSMLPPRERAAALLVYGEGYSHPEAAVMLGLPLGTLKSLVGRARSALVPLLRDKE